MEVRGPPPPAGELKKLKLLGLIHTQVTDAGCSQLAAAFDSGVLPALERLDLYGTRASAAAQEAALAALARSRAAALPFEEE